MAIDIGKLRRAARVCQVELAGLTGIDRTQLSAAERGYIVLTDSQIEAIRKALVDEPKRCADRIKEAFECKPSETGIPNENFETPKGRNEKRPRIESRSTPGQQQGNCGG